MSAVKLTPHHPESPQARMHQALRRLIYRIGVKESADLIGVDDDTIRRRLDTGNVNAFGWGEITALKKRERDEFSTSDLHDEETRAIYRKSDTLVINLDLSATLLRESGEDAGIIGEASAILQDGKVDASDLPRLEALLTKLQARQEHTQELEAGIRGKVDQLKRQVSR